MHVFVSFGSCINISDYSLCCYLLIQFLLVALHNQVFRFGEFVTSSIMTSSIHDLSGILLYYLPDSLNSVVAFKSVIVVPFSC